MKRIIFPIVLVAGVVGLLSVHAMPLTTLSEADITAIDTTPAKPDTTTTPATISSAFAEDVIAADTTPAKPDTTTNK
ncbi:MAG: hypothetical protein LBB79_02840 [Prevotellaceae bacterium]|jgi:hypothetical protein|nr:hypothetical protein [Prevotellaceae bacterium]